MMILQIKNQSFDCLPGGKTKRDRGFTLIEVIIAASIMIILSVGLLSVFSYVTKINRGENLRMHALSVLQKEIEIYRSAKFVPNSTDPILVASNHPSTKTVESLPDDLTRSIKFDITVDVINLPLISGVETAEAACKFKEITITAVPKVAETGWLANLRTNVTIQRVRSN
jgi:prepilin-type N-terminal cleavage/methylation domain-containing protein